MKQIEVTILSQSYVLGCPEGGEALLQAAVAAVDREMAAIRAAGKVKARERMAVLAALNLAYLLEQRPEATSPAAPDSTGDDASTPDTVDVDALIARIDHTLGTHGQLL